MRARVVGGIVLFLALVPWWAATGAAAHGQPESKKVAVPYKTAHDQPLDTQERVVSEADDHTKYRVEFNGIEGDRVPGYLYVPKHKGTKGRFPAILLQYGSGGNKNTGYIVEIGKHFVGRGYVVLTIDAPDRGERRGKGKRSSGVFGLLSPGEVMHYCGDYSRAVDFLCSRPEVDKSRLAYVGISWGAITGITYAAHDPRVKAVASVVGGGNFMGAYTPEAAAKALRNGSRSSDPVYHVARIAPRPLLFINVTNDQLIARAWAESLHKAAGPGAKVVWLETDHYFRGVDRAALCNMVIEFMDKSLAVRRAPSGR